MTTNAAMPDPTMESIGKAVTIGREGDTESARRDLLDIWNRIGVDGDPFHRCTLAHYLADLYDSPAVALMWDVRAFDAAATITNHRAQQHHASLQVAGFYPSLLLNIADNLRRLGSFEAATDYIDRAGQHTSALARDGYGDMIRTAINEVRQAISAHDTTPRPSAPSATQ
ncbi:hypothetical protein [Gordonia sp. KTR9]|uniref:hypothetical protein n=1 Tax=Gordonia sp. KTR9 TaxID=337191 RepID=UPI00027DE51C|nr:hypothetical protein [Gordonia sp. KTR9]AFR50888.1 hypothetical protein KTR9_4281 [Gordonia sp. KTR9]